jgi:hypothetical protein
MMRIVVHDYIRAQLTILGLFLACLTAVDIVQTLVISLAAT